GEAVEQVTRLRLQPGQHRLVVEQEQRRLEGRVELLVRLARGVREGLEEDGPRRAERRAPLDRLLAGRLQQRAQELLRLDAPLQRGAVFLRRHFLLPRRQSARTLIHLRQRQLAQQPLDVVLVRDELARQQVEQLGVRGRVL